MSHVPATTIEPAPALPEPNALVMAQETSDEDEWESLPHLDSTMMARGSELQIPARPPALVRPAAAPVARPQPIRGRREPAPAPIVDDYPTTPPSRMVSSGGDGFEDEGPPTSEQKAEPITDASLTAPPALTQAPAKAAPAPVEEPVTLPKSAGVWPAAAPGKLDDLGIDTSSDFAEDTDKGGGPKGFGGAAAQNVDPSPYLTGTSSPANRTLDVLNKLGKAKQSSPRVPTSGGRPGAWDNLPRKK